MPRPKTRRPKCPHALRGNPEIPPTAKRWTCKCGMNVEVIVPDRKDWPPYLEFHYLDGYPAGHWTPRR
jgi:hypothetical protein